MGSRLLHLAWARILLFLTFPALVYALSTISELSAELVTSTSGWAIYHHRLLWTSDVGGSWKDITPPLNADESISSTFFLDSSAGWVTILREGSALQSLVFATTLDGGQTWQKSVVEAANRFLAAPQIWSGTSHIFFLDGMNGWLELKRISSSNFKEGILLATKDRGKSWTELPQPPTVDKMTWISPEVGWIAGGVLQGDLFSTRDGGLTWQKQTPPVPSGTTDPFGQAVPPKFTDAQHGTFTVTFHGLKVNDSSALIAVYHTSDSGKTWVRSDLQEVPSLGGTAGVSLGGTPVWAHFAKGAVQTSILSNTNSTQVPSTAVALSADVVSASFADANTGFLLVQSIACDSTKANCTQTWRLLSTRDGGRNVADVTPPKPINSSAHASAPGAIQIIPTPEAITIPAHNTTVAGFDIASAPPLNKMAAAKPGYSVVGIYIGGGNRFDKVQVNLNNSWTFFTSCMGYSFAPLWVGPQAQGSDCSNCSKIPYTGDNATDEYNAYQLGAHEAANAASVIVSTYAWTDGAIVYYDMEPYTGTINNSSALVQNLIESLNFCK